MVEGTLSGNQRGLLAVIELRTSRLGRTSTKLFRLDVDHLELGELLFQTNESTCFHDDLLGYTTILIVYLT